MKHQYTLVYDNYEIANRLIAAGYHIIYIRPNLKREDKSLVFIFPVEAYEPLQEILKQLNYK